MFFLYGRLICNFAHKINIISREQKLWCPIQFKLLPFFLFLVNGVFWSKVEKQCQWNFCFRAFWAGLRKTNVFRQPVWIPTYVSSIVTYFRNFPWSFQVNARPCFLLFALPMHRSFFSSFSRKPTNWLGVVTCVMRVESHGLFPCMSCASHR